MKMVYHKEKNQEDDDDLDREEDQSGEFAALLDAYMADSAAEVRVGDKINRPSHCI